MERLSDIYPAPNNHLRGGMAEIPASKPLMKDRGYKALEYSGKIHPLGKGSVVQVFTHLKEVLS